MGEIVIFAGSGVSVDEPANLPSWWEYNKALIEEIKRQALLLCPEAKRLLEPLDVEKDLPVQCVSDIIVRGGAGSAYFPLLKLLDGSMPNANHLAMVELAKTGQISAIITTNFDTLVETSFQSKAVPLIVLFTDDDFVSISAGNVCRLMKVHGSVVDEKSLIDTVTQKSGGLSYKKKLALSGAMSGADVVVMGFSGADLEFDPDYIPFESALEKGGSITWLCRHGASVHPIVSTLGNRWGEKFQIVEQELRDFFVGRGVSYDDLVEWASSRANAALSGSEKHVCWDDAKQEIRGLFSQPFLGPHACVGYCLTMLSMTGRFAEAKELGDLYERKLELQGIDVLSVTGLYALAGQKAECGDFVFARKWMGMVIACLTELDRINMEIESDLDGDAKSRESVRMLEHFSNMASAYVNRGIYAEKSGDTTALLNDLDTARKYAEACHNEYVLGMVAYGEVRARFASDGDYDEYIDGLRKCKAIIQSTGNMRGLAEVLHDECAAHLMLGEYAAAEDVLENSSIVLKNVGSFDLTMHQTLLEADLSIRRNREPEALVAIESLVSAVERTKSKKWACIVVQLLMEGLRCSEGTNSLLRRLAEFAGYNPNQVVEEYCSYDTDWWSKGRPIPAWIAKRIPEDRLRNKLVVGEYSHHGACSAVLHMICIEYVKRESWMRLLDLASCYLRSATTADAMAKAHYYSGCAYMEQGHYGLAKDEFVSALAVRGEVGPVFIGWAHAELAKIYIIQGSIDAAEREYRAIFDTNSRDDLSGETASMCMSCIRQLMHVGRWTEARIKTEELLGVCTVEQEKDIRAVLKTIERKISREECVELKLEDMSPEEIATYANCMYKKCGDAVRACDLLLASKRGYEERGDTAGVAKCENNLGVIQKEEGSYEDAKQHFMESARINGEIGHVQDMMRQLANAIMLQADGVDAANEVAYVELRLNNYPPCPEKSSLLLSLYAYYFAETKPIEAYRYAKLVLENEDHFVQYGVGYTSEIDASTFETIKQFISLVESCFSPTTARLMSEDEFSTDLEEATRLYHASNFEAAHALLDKLAKDAAYDAKRLGQVAGTCGNALLQEGKYRDAERQFRKSISSFDEALQQGENVNKLRLAAYNGLFLALDRSGRTEEVLGEIEALLSVEGVNHDMFNIIINYCNRLFEKHCFLEKDGQVYYRALSKVYQGYRCALNKDDPDYLKIKDLLDELSGLEGSTLEESGNLSLAYGNLSYCASDMEEALGHFEDAKHFFANANSPNRVLVEMMISKLKVGME